MILRSRYNKIMDNIQVTDEIRDRIMRKVDETDFNRETKNRSSFHKYSKMISLAACLAIICIGIIGGKLIFDKEDNLLEQTTSGIVEYTSIDELNKNVGFEIEEVKNVPFHVNKTTYTVYWGELAEITYSNDQEELVYRKAVGEEDISGDYNKYSKEKKCIIGQYEVIIKGNKSGFTLAIWTKAGYSYSLDLSRSVSEDEIFEIIKNLD